jgi:hypothetical protein
MTNILDTVEPDAYRYNKVRGLDKEPFGTEYSEAPPRQNPGLTEQCSSVDQLYSRETVERLLAERDAEVASLKKRLGEQNQKIYGIALQLRQDAASDPYDDRDTCPKWLAQRMRDAADKLRRMAEGEK